VGSAHHVALEAPVENRGGQIPPYKRGVKR
jgi:hypothetical protein